MATPFYEITFPDHIARGAEVTLRHRTEIRTGGGGQERRNRRWSRGPLRWADAARGIRNTTDLEQVRAFHLVVEGAHVGFRFRDFSDYSAQGQLIDTTIGGTVFQLRKGYTIDAYTKWRTIRKPTPRTTRVTLNGVDCVVLENGESLDDWVAVWGEAGWGFNPYTAPQFSLVTTTGVLTRVSPAGALSGADVLLALFEFEIPARFVSDDFTVRAVSRGKNWEYSGLLIKELR